MLLETAYGRQKTDERNIFSGRFGEGLAAGSTDDDTYSRSFGTLAAWILLGFGSVCESDRIMWEYPHPLANENVTHALSNNE
jgi:hypothetical protein